MEERGREGGEGRYLCIFQSDNNAKCINIAKVIVCVVLTRLDIQQNDMILIKQLY